MKLLLTISTALLFGACTTKTIHVADVSARTVPGTTLPTDAIESVRYAENIKTYPIGRYVDPGDSRIMHEGHSIYRAETTAKWNLHPNDPLVMPFGPLRVRDSALAPSPVGDELVVQLNQQKEATKAVIQGEQLVTQKLGELAGKFQQTQQIAAQNAQLKQEVDTARQRLDALEEQMRSKSPVTPANKQPEQSEKSEW